MRLYTIYDRLAQEAGPIFECKNDAVALRSIVDVIKHDYDRYHLLYLGHFNHDPVSLISLEVPEEVSQNNVYVEDKDA